MASAILGIREIYSAQGHAAAMHHGYYLAIFGILDSALCGAAAYGIHKKAFIAWVLGWGVLAANFLGFLRTAWSALSNLPDKDDPGVAKISVVVAAAAVTAYWGFWWYKQKSYFTKLGSVNHPSK